MDAATNDQSSDEQLKRSVMEQLDALDTEDKIKVLDFSRELAVRRRSRDKGGSLLAFAGSIPGEDLAEMKLAIEEACETVDEETW